MRRCTSWTKPWRSRTCAVSWRSTPGSFAAPSADSGRPARSAGQDPAGLAGARTEPIQEILLAHRHREGIALDEIAAQRAKHVDLFAPLDSLGDDLGAQAVHQVNHRRDDRTSVLAAVEVPRQARIELHAVDRHILHPREV